MVQFGKFTYESSKLIDQFRMLCFLNFFFEPHYICK